VLLVKKLAKMMIIVSMIAFMPSAAVAYPGGASFTFEFCQKDVPNQMHLNFVSMPCWAQSLLNWPF
jgi:hypothetical protein